MSSSVSESNHNVIIVLGPPGSGKGTQCRRLSEVLKLPHVSTGDLLRDHVEKGLVLGQQVRALMDRGELVPDETVLAMLQARLSESDCQGGFILDGFPRNKTQAELLSVSIDNAAGLEQSSTTILRLSIPGAILVERITRRRTCLSCGRAFNSKKGADEPIARCEFDGSELVVRRDDGEETFRNRLTTFDSLIPGITSYYEAKGFSILDIQADAQVEEITASILSKLGLSKGFESLNRRC